MDNTLANIQIPWDEMQRAFDTMPRHIAHWLEYEAAVFYNPINVVEFYQSNPVLTWDYVFQRLKEHSRDMHRSFYGGTHPSLDPPGPVW